jgi:rhodanese-related sulfurtransferase
MSLTIITPAEAKRRIAQGATLIDIRDKDEHAHEHIAGTRNFPLSTLTDLESRGRSSFTAAPVNARPTMRAACSRPLMARPISSKAALKCRAPGRARQEPAHRDQPTGDDRRRQPRAACFSASSSNPNSTRSPASSGPGSSSPASVAFAAWPRFSCYALEPAAGRDLKPTRTAFIPATLERVQDPQSRWILAFSAPASQASAKIWVLLARPNDMW